MTRFLLASTVMVSLVLIGCDEAKDSTKSATNAAKDAANKGAAAVKDAADNTKEAAEAAKTKVVDALKTEVDAIKTKIDSLTKGASSVKEADKPAYTKDMGEINGLLKSVTDGWEKLKTSATSEWSKISDDLKVQAKTLMDKVNAAMTKYGIK